LRVPALAALGRKSGSNAFALNLLASAETSLWRAGELIDFYWRSRMTKATRISAPVSTPVVTSASAESHPLVSIALFSAIGLLISLLVIIADQHLPGEWF
jgi:hypothetical protein